MRLTAVESTIEMSLTLIRINLNLLASYISRIQQSQLASQSSAYALDTMGRRRKIPSLHETKHWFVGKYSQMSKPNVGRWQLRRRVNVFNRRRSAIMHQSRKAQNVALSFFQKQFLVWLSHIFFQTKISLEFRVHSNVHKLHTLATHFCFLLCKPKSSQPKCRPKQLLHCLLWAARHRF